MQNNGGSGGFWSSIPGILTGIAALITAVAGILVLTRQSPSPNPTPTPAAPRDQTPRAETPQRPRVPNERARATNQMGSLQPGISYNQGDIYDRPAKSPEECSTLCYNDDRCVAMTFIISQQRCWIKNQIGPIGQTQDMVSARKQGQ